MRHACLVIYAVTTVAACAASDSPGGSGGSGGASGGSGAGTGGRGGSGAGGTGTTGAGGSGTTGAGGSGTTGAGGAGGSGTTGAGGAGGSGTTTGAGGSGTTGAGGSGMTTGAGGATGAGGSGMTTGAGGTGGAGGNGGNGGTTGGGVTVYDCNWGAPVFTSLAASAKPPGGLAVDNVPMLIALGFDDNAYPDGMAWILDFMKSKVNPAGRGNACTFDGTPARATFFNNSHVGVAMDPIKQAHLRAYREGHEAANHTDTHAETLQRNPDKAVWLKEISTCTDYHVGLGIPRADFIGFRTPFLQQSDQTFDAIVELGFKYDCSIEHYYGVDGFAWPYTLDQGKSLMYAYNAPPGGKYPKLWELPVYELMTSTTGYSSVTGFDYNMWISQKMTRAKAVETLKASLAVRLQGGNAAANRAPLLFGAHTDLYSTQNMEALPPGTAPIADRRAAIEEFLTYALGAHPAVRVVPYAQVMHWMQAPVGLDGTKGK
jgi:hypothetical protein